MYDIITIGGVLKDIIFLSEKGETFVNPKRNPLCEKLICFESGAKEIIKGAEAFIGFGGGAANTAVGFKKLDFRVGIFAQVGNDLEGKDIIKNLKKLQIDTFINLDKKYPTGFSLIIALKNGLAQTIFTYRGANNKLKIKNEKLKMIKTKWFYVSSLTTPNWREILNRIFSKINNKRYAIGNKPKIAWNPGSNQLKTGLKGLKKYLSKTDALILNEDEALELVSSKLKIKNEKLKIADLLKILNSSGPKIVTITCGKKGAYAFDGKKIYFKKVLPVKVANTTGAGDAFSSAFVGSLILMPQDLSQALNWGIKNSASVIKKFGAQNGLLTRKQLTTNN